MNQFNRFKGIQRSIKFLSSLRNFIIRKIILLLISLLSIFTIGGYAEPIDFADSTSLEDRIHAKAKKIRDEGKTVDQLDMQDLANLPIGIVKKIGGIEYMIFIDSVRFTPEAAYLSAYASLEMTAMNKRLAFGATDILFQPGGLSASTSTKLELLSKAELQLGKNINFILPPDGSNYVEFDCNGFKSINVKGIFEFSKELLLPADSTKEKVTASIEGNFADLNSILASITIDPFKPQKFPEITVDAKLSYIDLSDVVNPSAFIMPLGYTGPSENPAFWQGFFIKEARITLPKKLKGDGDGINIDVQDLIIDKKGFSGKLGVANLFGTDDGNLNGWPISIDSLGIHIIKNQLMGAAFKGEIVVPPFDKESPLEYTAIASSDIQGNVSYLFNLQTSKELKASALMADIQLIEGSTITIKEVNGKFLPEAMLNGYLSVSANEKLAVKKLKFESLHLSSEKPFIRSGIWSLTGEGSPTAGKFPIVIDDVKLHHAGDELKLSLDVMLNLMNSESKGFAASTTVMVEAGLEEETKLQGEETITVQKWEYKRTHISEATLEFESKAFALKGSVAFYENHPKMGNGFRGELDARFGSDVQVKAVAQFGKVDGFKYWYADALVKLNIPAGTGFAIYGIGGGAYYHMKIKEAPRPDYATMQSVTGNSDANEIGLSRSKAEYIPDKSIGLGFKASVVVGLSPEPKPFNGVATFEMAFNSKGGINFIGFSGEGCFMKNINDPVEKAKMYALLDIKLDFENDELHGELLTYINLGDNLLRGSHANGLAGKAVIHVDKTDWYLHVGTPSQRISINILGAAQIGSYFMVGTYMPDFPSVGEVIPENLISSIKGDLDGFMRDENALATGGGIAFGASFSMDTGKKTFLIFYGRFNVGLGFDVMLRDYGNVNCVGQTEPIGINGWYASGQAWVYFQGEIGIKVKLKFVKGDFPIMDVGMAAIVQAKLPNPTVVNGYIAGKYNILGGLVKGDFNFKVEIGEACEFESSGELDIEVIAEVQPGGSEKVDVFTAPQVAFNVPVNKVFELYDIASDKSKAYQVKLDQFTVKKGTQVIAGEVQFNDDNKVAIYNSFEILPPQSQLKTEVKVSWHERVNGTWRPIGGNTPDFEEKSVTFNTGEAPDYIPEHNIEYSYPVTGMMNFYPGEHPQGYMKLKSGQSYLFENRENFEFVTRFESVGSMNTKVSSLTYNEQNKTITYNLPSPMELSRNYNISFVKKPKNTLIVDANVKQVQETLEASTDATIILETQDIEGVVVLEEEEVLYESYFGTSRYTTFNDKLNALGSPMEVAKYSDYYNVYTLGLLMNPSEAFDYSETYGKGEMEALVHFEAVPQNNQWYNSTIYPLIYSGYPISGNLKISWRDTQEFGIPPLKGVYQFQQNGYPELTAENLYSERGDNGRGDLVFLYDLSYIAMRDFYDLKNAAGSIYTSSNINQAPAGAVRLLRSNFTDYTPGTYDFKVYYQLPGKSIRTTERIYTAVKN